MDRLLYFFYNYRAFFTFLLIQLFCAWLVIENNHYQGAKFFNSSNRMVAGMLSFSNSVSDFFYLRETSKILAEENAMLREQLDRNKLNQEFVRPLLVDDSISKKHYEFISAKVVNNTTRKFKNFITINKGSNDGVEAGMAVISSLGVVGKVKSVSPNFAVVTSVLHTDVMVSSRIKRTGHVGTTQWDGYDPSLSYLKFIPRHVKVQPGDTIITSGFNAVFPENIMIGSIKEISITDEAVFYDLKISLSQDFDKLAYVYVIKYNLFDEVQQLEEDLNL
jgi:rod shape-determining protein MreC